MPTRKKFFVGFRAAVEGEGGAWYVTTSEHGREATAAGPYRLKSDAMAYAIERAKNIGLPAQVMSQKKGQRRWNTEGTYPRSSDPRKTKGTSRRRK